MERSARVVGVFEVNFASRPSNRQLDVRLLCRLHCDFVARPRSMSDTHVVLSAIESADSALVVWNYRLNKFARLDTQRSEEVSVPSRASSSSPNFDS